MVANAKLMPPRRPFTVDEYRRMANAGILTKYDRVELIEGEIVEKVRVGARHIGCVIELTHVFTIGLAERAWVSVRGPVQLPPRSEPEPDLAILRLRPDEYRTAIPRGEDVLLVMEVSDTSLAYDRGVKLRLYAEAGIPEAWIWDLKGRRLLRFLEPAGGAYRVTDEIVEGSVSPMAFPDLRVSVEEVLG